MGFTSAGHFVHMHCYVSILIAVFFHNALLSLNVFSPEKRGKQDRWVWGVMLGFCDE